MRWMGVISVFLVLAGPAAASRNVVKDAEGKTIAVIYDCSSCKAPGNGAQCTSGVESGYSDGKPCGKCLLDANFGFRIGYDQDLLISGYLKDGEGKPVTNRFVKLALPNTWNYRTRTLEDGQFRLMLGATLDRKGRDPLRVDLGEHIETKSGTADYMLYMLPEDHKPCK